MLSLSEVNRRARASEAACEEALPRLMAAYHLAIIKLGRVAVRNFAAAKVVHLAAADTPERITPWSMPDLDELFTVRYGAEVLEEVTREARTQLALNATGPWAAESDVAVRSRLTGIVQALLAQRITEVAQHVRDEAAQSVRLSLDAGESVHHASQKLAADFREFAPARARLIARTEMIGAANAASLAMVRETGAATHKRWLATNDARTRPTHADANGQVVAVDAPFRVGGALLQYPGAEGAPASEVCNCRCTLVYEEAPLTPIPASAEPAAYENLEAAIAAADMPTEVTMRGGAMRFVTMAVAVPEADAAPEDTQTGTRFEMLLAPLDEPTDDGRILSPAEPGAIGWRELPLSLMAQFETQGGHDGARIVGRIDEIGVAATTAGTWSGQAFVATGVFDDGPEGSEDGRQAARLAREGFLRGVSIDLAIEEVEMRTPDNEPIAADDEEAQIAAMFGEGLMAVTRGSIMGATITPFPAFAEAGVTLVASIDQAHAILAAGQARTAEAGHSGPLPAVEGQEGVTLVEGAQSLYVALAGPPRVTADQAQAYAVLVAAGLATTNEVRGWLQLVRAHGGDTLRIGDGFQVVAQTEQNMESIAASIAALAAQATTPTPPPAPPQLRRLRVERDDTGQAVRYVEEPTDG